MDLVSILPAILENGGQGVGWLAAVVVLGTLWLKKSAVDVDSITSVSKAQSDAMAALVQQNRELAADLHAMRDQQRDLHESMDALRQENGRMYQHILQLERLVQHYAPRCASCPQGPGDPPVVVKMPFNFKESR